MQKLILLTVLLYILQVHASAQQRQFDRPMQLIECSIDIKANLFTATTFIEMEFYNDNSLEIEGLFTFQLRPEQVITAFQLELDGKYRDGSIEEKWKARNSYNSIVGKRVDPALLMMNGVGNYSLNIYPVPAKGTRKVTMTIDQLLKTEGNDLVYQLPLSVQSLVKDFQLSIQAGTDQNIPTVKKGLIEDKVFSYSPGQYILNWTEKDLYLQKPISFSMPLTSEPVVCGRLTGKETLFALRFRPSCHKEFEIHPQKITIFWDASSSSNSRDINKEINFLKQFVSVHKIKQLTIIPFNQELIDTAIFYTSAGFNSRWDDYLRNMKYDGATQLGKIDLRNFSSDIFFIFTDGNNTYGRSNPITGLAHVYCLYTSSAANEAALKKITGTSGGRVIDLRTTGVSQAVTINNKGENWLMGISSSTGKTVIDQSLPLPVSKGIFLNGRMVTGNDTLIVKYGYNNKVTSIQKIYLSANIECIGKNIDRIPAFKRFEELFTSYDWESVLEFGLKEKMVTTNTAFIVLENVEDYIKYNIAPPKDLEKQCEDLHYVRKDTREQRQRLKLADEYETLEHTVRIYNEKIKRWDRDALPIELTRSEFENVLARRVEGNNIVMQSMPSVSSLSANLFGSTSANLSEVVVTGYGTQQRRLMTGAVSIVRGNTLSSSMNIEGALAGRVAGLSITSSDYSVPGSGASIRIRGAAAMSGNREPLFVIDGTAVSGNINELINVNDIESITVMKDAQAGALFGSRAANGAIVITSKKRNYNYNWNYYNNYKPYRLKDMDDVDYIAQIKEITNEEKYITYLQLRAEYRTQPVFYFDMAQHFFEAGLKNEAYEILMNAAEESKADMQASRAIGFVLEGWKWFEKAIEVYEALVENYPAQPEIRRDLALAYYQNGNYQKAVNMLYDVIRSNVNTNEYGSFSLRSTMLNEMNAIILLHKDSLNLENIPSSLIKPLPVDLRIVVETNGSGLGNVSIKEPGGEDCSYASPVTRNGFIDNGYYWYFAPAEYQAKNAKEGKYKISVNYYGYNSWLYKTPDFVRIVSFQNFGKPGQQIKIENVIMDNQYGEVEIGEVNR